MLAANQQEKRRRRESGGWVAGSGLGYDEDLLLQTALRESIYSSSSSSATASRGGGDQEQAVARLDALLAAHGLRVEDVPRDDNCK